MTRADNSFFVPPMISVTGDFGLSVGVGLRHIPRDGWGGYDTYSVTAEAWHRNTNSTLVLLSDSHNLGLEPVARYPRLLVQ